MSWKEDQRVGLFSTVWRCCWRKGILKPVLFLAELLWEQWANGLDVFGCPWESCSFGPFQHPLKCLFKPSFIWKHGPVHELCPSWDGSGLCSNSTPLGFGQSLPLWEATLYSRAQNIFHLLLIIFISINIFANGANRDLVWTLCKPWSHVCNRHQFIFFTAHQCPKAQERLCLLTKHHAHLWESRNKEYHWSHWCPINK